MMADLEYITPEEARARLLVAYRRSGDGAFVETLQRPLLNPVEKRDTSGRRKLHPLLVLGLVLVALAAAAIAFFSLQ